MKTIFFGTPEFAAYSLQKLIDNGVDVAAVVTMPDKRAGRKHHLTESDVKKTAVKAGLPVLQPSNLKDPEFIEQLRSIGADLFIVIAFRMLPQAVWAMPPLGTFNLHASLLPKYRGAAPINRAVMNGEKETGVTSFFLKHEIDTGDIIGSRRIEIGENENVGSVHDRLMELGADMVVETLRNIEDGTCHTTPQPEGDFTPAPKIFKEDCEIDWTKTAEEVHNHIRGLSPYPASWTVMTDKSGREIEIKIYESRLTDDPVGETLPGTAVTLGKRMLVACSDRWLEIVCLQPTGRKRMETEAFLAGYHPASMHRLA